MLICLQHCCCARCRAHSNGIQHAVAACISHVMPPCKNSLHGIVLEKSFGMRGPERGLNIMEKWQQWHPELEHMYVMVWQRLPETVEN